MKYGIIPFLFIFIISCGSKTDKTGVSKVSTFQDTTSYVLGADIGENLKRQQIEIDFDENARKVSYTFDNSRSAQAGYLD